MTPANKPWNRVVYSKRPIELVMLRSPMNLTRKSGSMLMRPGIESKLINPAGFLRPVEEVSPSLIGSSCKFE